MQKNFTRTMKQRDDLRSTDENQIAPGELACCHCGYSFVDYSEGKAAVQKEYNYSDEDLDGGTNIIKIWCPQCAIADNRVDDVSEVDDGDFYWEVR